MSDDLIRRSDAIKAIEEHCFFINQCTYPSEGCIEVIEDAINVPSADRPQGEWIYTNNPLRLDDEWACSRCGNISFLRTNFCDRCGSRMKGAGDD